MRTTSSGLTDLRAWRFLAVTMVVGLAAMAVLIAMVLSVALVGTLPLLPRLTRAARRLAAAERLRTGRFLGTPIPSPPQTALDGVGAVLTSVHARRDAQWLAFQAVVGTLAGSIAVGAPAGVLQNVVIAVVWPFFPGITTTLAMPVGSWGGAVAALGTALGYGLVGVFAVPPLARWYAKTGTTRLAPSKATLVERLAEVTATRAATLEAHGTELQRIERSLHDGTQNRLVAVVMHLGMVERALRRDPSSALPLVLTAQNAATDALAELREVVRGIYPPVLVDRGLAGAVAALVAHCPIPCTLDARPHPRVPAAVEAAAYFVVAEALTNAVKHSGATLITVHLRAEDDLLVVEVGDDGRGGADESLGTGLVGIRRRVAAFDGSARFDSPTGGPTALRVRIPAGP